MNERLAYLREKTAALTTQPGCYIMKNKAADIIYIGKAKNLRNRVTSYFRENPDHLPKVARMVSNVYDYDFIVTDSEFEALILECNLIKLHKPKYNILLKDDKGYSYIRITKEPFPRITAELQKKTDDIYLGPYISGYTSKQTVNEANTVFMLPTCKKKFPQEIGKQRPCLNYYIKKCMGVCTGNISQKDYNETIEQAVEYIKSGSATSIERLTESMKIASENMNYELAAKLRDRIKAIEKANDKQKVVDINAVNTDVVGIAKNGTDVVISIIMYRNGRLFDKNDFFLNDIEASSTVYDEFIIQYYSEKEDIPRELLLDDEVENIEMIENYLREKACHAVSVKTPKRGASLQLTMLAKNNASEYLSIKVGRTGKEIQALSQIAKILGLEKPPMYIECYDISNLSSSDMVAGMVVFENGRPLKKAYKKFSIKTVDEQNDYACMQEIIRRRFNRYKEGIDEGFSQLPDLILLDGGKGHVAAVEPVLEGMGINVPLYGLVKDNNHRTRAIASSGAEISISSLKSAFLLLTRIQDEVHRFAITYQRKTHNKSSKELVITRVKGVGQKKAAKIITYYKTKDELKKALPEELAKVAGINIVQAKQLYEVIQNDM